MASYHLFMDNIYYDLTIESLMRSIANIHLTLSNSCHGNIVCIHTCKYNNCMCDNECQ